MFVDIAQFSMIRSKKELNNLIIMSENKTHLILSGRSDIQKNNLFSDEWMMNKFGKSGQIAPDR